MFHVNQDLDYSAMQFATESTNGSLLDPKLWSSIEAYTLVYCI